MILMEQKELPLNSPEAKALLRDPTALRTLIQSDQAKQLIALLQRQGNLNDAARQAKNGDMRALQQMLNQVSAAPEGQQAISQIQKRIQG